MSYYMRLISICLAKRKIHQLKIKIECLETSMCNIVSIKGSKLGEVTKTFHLHARIGYIQKWMGTLNVATPGNKDEGASIFNTVFEIPYLEYTMNNKI